MNLTMGFKFEVGRFALDMRRGDVKLPENVYFIKQQHYNDKNGALDAAMGVCSEHIEYSLSENQETQPYDEGRYQSSYQDAYR